MIKDERSDAGLHITEGVAGTWYYHLSPVETNARGLCGAQTMNTQIPMSAWGSKGHLGERYCKDCQRLGDSELRAAGVAIPA